MNNKTKPPFANAQPPIELSEFTPGTRRPKSQTEEKE